MSFETIPCPYCESPMEADWVDVGVGHRQCGPYVCQACGSSEIGPEYNDWCYKDHNGHLILLKEKRTFNPLLKQKIQFETKPVLKHGHPFTQREIDTGFYEPKSNKQSPYANTINGKIVNHKIAERAYREGKLD